MSARLLCGDVRDVLKTLPDASAHMCVTSPPYYGLRDYGTATWDGGDVACDHVAGMARKDTERETPGGRGGSFRGGEVQYRATCAKCGARRIDQQIGLEPTPDAYVATIVDVMRQVWRVLRDDGTLWLNLGDGHSAKQLLGIPWRVALALQADGWWLRSDIIWSKPNPMPESVTDRPTRAHEYIFLLTKSARYFYDAVAVAEPSVGGAKGSTFTDGKTGVNGLGRVSELPREDAATRNKRSVWTISTQGWPESHYATYPEKLVEPMIMAGTSAHGCCSACGAPWRRTVERELSGVNEHRPDRLLPGREGNGHQRMRAGDSTTLTTGWQPTCPHADAPVIPCTVLDPFIGSGTTAVVALRHGRDCIGIDLDARSIEMARKRVTNDAPLFNRVEVA